VSASSSRLEASSKNTGLAESLNRIRPEAESDTTRFSHSNRCELMKQVLDGSSKKLPSLAMVTGVRDEEEFLQANLTYHHALGVSRAYVFLDRCTDSTPEIVRSFPWARAIPADRDDEITHLTSYLNKCADQALDLAREEGFEWLLHIDADEFAWGDNHPGKLSQLLGQFQLSTVRALEEIGSLPAMLAIVRPETEMVRMRTKEVIPLAMAPGKSFWGLHYFQDGGIVARQMLDPITMEIKQLNKWLGHMLGKNIVRTAADVQAFSSHIWTRKQETHPPRLVDISTEHKGFVYHFVVTGGRHWRHKYRKLSEYPAYWKNGEPVPFPKQCWKEASAILSEPEAQRYYDEWVVIRPQDLVEYLSQGIAVCETYVEKILASSGYLGRSGGMESSHD
jgi:hypothetical protein